MVIHPCAKYGKPMSNQKKLLAGHESAQTDEQTDRQSDRVIPISPPELHSRGYKYAHGFSLCKFSDVKPFREKETFNCFL